MDKLSKIPNIQYINAYEKGLLLTCKRPTNTYMTKYLPINQHEAFIDYNTLDKLSVILSTKNIFIKNGDTPDQIDVYVKEIEKLGYDIPANAQA